MTANLIANFIAIAAVIAFVTCAKSIVEGWQRGRKIRKGLNDDQA